MVKNLPAIRETCFQSLGWEDPLEKEMAIHSSILPGESHDHSPWGHKELEKTELVTHTCLTDFSLIFLLPKHKWLIMIKYYYLNKSEYCTLEYFIKKLHMLNYVLRKHSGKFES